MEYQKTAEATSDLVGNKIGNESFTIFLGK